jgi:hypothetical protein
MVVFVATPVAAAEVRNRYAIRLGRQTFLPVRALRGDERPARQNGRELWTRGMLVTIEKYKRYISGADEAGAGAAANRLQKMGEKR